MDAISAGSYKTMEPPEIRAGGYVVKALEAVLWAFYHTDTFKEGCLKVGKNSNRVLWLSDRLKSIMTTQ